MPQEGSNTQDGSTMSKQSDLAIVEAEERSGSKHPAAVPRYGLSSRQELERGREMGSLPDPRLNVCVSGRVRVYEL